eukprot:superscaffoldBa00000450_g4821
MSAGRLQRCSSEVTEQFPYKAHKTIPLKALQSTESGGGVQPLRSATGVGFQLGAERRALLRWETMLRV